MGFKICYLASRATPAELLAGLHLTAGETADDMPQEEWWCARLKSSGWTILLSEDEEYVQRAATLIAELSQRHDTYVCEVNETVMWSSAAFWSEGRQIWRVTHNGGDDHYDLNEVGDVPKAFAALKKRKILQQKQEGEDVDCLFDAPIEFVESKTEVRHDVVFTRDDVDAFIVIEPPAPPRKKGLLARLFGS